MKLYIAVTEYSSYDCCGDEMYFLHVLGIGKTLDNGKQILKEAWEKLHKQRHSWTHWRLYEVTTDVLDLDMYNDFSNKEPVFWI